MKNLILNKQAIKIIENDKVILDILLKDRTTGSNIIWATTDYEEEGIGFDSFSEITFDKITGRYLTLIQPRITKAIHHQLSRTKKRAEVFTPSWLCNQQNNLIDEEWFGRKDIFNIEKINNWETQKEKIKFPEEKGKTWKEYIDAKRLEISCGEGPYLVSRYDTVTGKIIEINDRIGLLDRKLRIVNENVDKFEEWFKWVERAYQSIYGYEFQGDNLVIVRKNLLYTFIDNINYKFSRNPTLIELKKIALIISWNIWQMDGRTCKIPYIKYKKKNIQLSIFDTENYCLKKEFCEIKDWRANKKIEFISLVKNGG